MKNQLIKIGGGQLIEDDYLSELLRYQEQFKNVESVRDLIGQVVEAIQALAQGYLPPALPFLEINENMVGDVQKAVVEEFPNDPVKGNQRWEELIDALEELDYQLHHFRDFLIEQFSMYGYVSTPWIQEVAKYLHGRSVLELMAGHGYLTAGLRAINPEQKIIAVDNEDWRNQPDPTHAKPVTDIEVLDALTAVNKYAQEVEVIVISWAPDTDETDWQILEQLRNDFAGEILIVGEYQGATNSRRFWNEAKLTELEKINQKFPSFDLIDEKMHRVE
ncbi:MAG: SAM-dependent methyltransferase [Lactobacillaceae bacterium]|jgi:hypothetical protein|nr:SAM-dependent methyltransferase [Lactobacillaceae bacterium]